MTASIYELIGRPRRTRLVRTRYRKQLPPSAAVPSGSAMAGYVALSHEPPESSAHDARSRAKAPADARIGAS